MATAKKKQEERANQMDSDEESEEAENYELDNNNIKDLPHLDSASLFPSNQLQWSGYISDERCNCQVSRDKCAWYEWKL